MQRAFALQYFVFRERLIRRDSEQGAGAALFFLGAFGFIAVRELDFGLVPIFVNVLRSDMRLASLSLLEGDDIGGNARTLQQVAQHSRSGGVARLATSAARRQGENGRQGQGYFYHGLVHSFPLAPRLLRTPFLLCRGRRDKAKKNPSHPADQRLPRKIALDLRGLGKFISDSCISVQRMYSPPAK